MNSSNLSTTPGLALCGFARGLVDVGKSHKNVGCWHCGSTKCSTSASNKRVLVNGSSTSILCLRHRAKSAALEAGSLTSGSVVFVHRSISSTTDMRLKGWLKSIVTCVVSAEDSSVTRFLCGTLTVMTCEPVTLVAICKKQLRITQCYANECQSNVIKRISLSISWVVFINLL